MPPSTTKGLSKTTTILSADLVVDMSKKLLLLEGDKNKLVKWVGQMKKEKAIQPRFDWMDDQYVPTTDTSAAGALIGDLSITMDNPWHRQNDLLLNPTTGEVVRVTATDAASLVLTITRGFAGAAAAIAPGATLVRVGSAWGEGSSLRDSGGGIISLEPIKNSQYNYLQVFRKALSISGTEQATSEAGGTYSGNARKHQQMLLGLELAKEMNQAFYFGKRAASGDVRATGGIDEFITTNVSASVGVTYSSLEADLEPMFRYGAERKVLFASKRVSRKITLVAGSDTIRITPGEDTFGIRTRHWMANAGDVDIIVDDTIEGPFASRAYLIDMTDVAYRFLPGRDTKLYVNAQLPDVDGVVDAYLAEVGLQRGLEKHHGKFTSIAA